jgi:hypothetical protein
MVRKAALAIAFLIAAPAAAQMQTTCSQTGPFTNCTTTGSPTPPAPPVQPPSSQPNYSGWGNLFKGIQARRERKREEAQIQEAQARVEADRQAQAANRAAVVQKVRSGDCAGAQSLALDQGDLTLARQVVDYCKAAAH